MPEKIVLTLLASFLMVGALTVVVARRPATGAIGFLAVLLAVAGLFALLAQSFLFLAQILVSVGAVVVLTLIVVLTINLKEEQFPKERFKPLWFVTASIVTAPFGWLLYETLVSVANRFPEAKEGFGTIEAVGKTLFSDWVLPFEILSLLLLAAMVGAIIIGKKEQAYDLRT
ncbi:NADH-quinone oxidoreductase subunit J family protein [Hydrogenimonas urashimensis]|uniref:NADH-quinone oxidoreductase subunit J family protein n=1 Tax=Hydrogenimonas urashimensis TaxID=2740515 RepID=UPI001915F8E9|nr:NADH-quinone oxidoreductase subunit J [Hydrogenimonas urashimensis]